MNQKVITIIIASNIYPMITQTKKTMA